MSAIVRPNGISHGRPKRTGNSARIRGMETVLPELPPLSS
jgi:hypothetical protein